MMCRHKIIDSVDHAHPRRRRWLAAVNRLVRPSENFGDRRLVVRAFPHPSQGAAIKLAQAGNRNDWATGGERLGRMHRLVLQAAGDDRNASECGVRGKDSRRRFPLGRESPLLGGDGRINRHLRMTDQDQGRREAFGRLARQIVRYVRMPSPNKCYILIHPGHR